MFHSKHILTTLLTLLFCCGLFSSLMAQKDATLDVKKPEKYDKRVLGSDKTFTTKYTLPRKVIQNLSTHYNFFFNANIKLNDVVNGAKQGFRDDYTMLLPFYNYTLDATSAQKTELDSVLMKCNAAILLHDLRNEWIDDMYMLMGKAYFFKNQMDSAGITFQYINYYFQPKKTDELGYKKYVGSNLNDDGNVYSISTKEKRSIVSKIFNEPPGRNDALVWLVRTFIEDSSYGAASGMLQTLKRDELFPNRLKPQLEETEAYLFYKKGMWDSAALHLIPGLDNAANSQEKARWEYLIAQLFALSKRKAEADGYFDLCIKHTIDPIMEVYARLNKIRLVQGENDEKVIQENLQQLLRMAKKDKYYNYRSIIYYTAAQMEMQRNNFEGAKGWLLKSVKYNNEDLTQRNRSYLYLGDLAFEKKDYELAHRAYDSLDVNSPVVPDADVITQRKESLSGIITKLQTIKVQDSLQKIVAMPEAEREKFLKAAAKKLRRLRGLKEVDSLGVNSNNPFANKPPPDLFAGNQSKGEWYFYNTSLKSTGFTAFRSTWGTRPNVDNWRRIADVALQVKSPVTNPGKNNAGVDENKAEAEQTDISYEGLLKTLPLTPEALKASDDSIQTALFGLGKTFKDKFEDYEEAIKKYEDLLNRYPDTRYQEEAIFDLHYCYTKLNLPVKAKQYRELLGQHYKQSKYLEYIDNPKGVEERKAKVKTDATRNYEQIYNLFLEGKFDEAVKRKAVADSLYGNIYWTQQLLYIEAVYHIKQHNDSAAINSLNNLIQINKEAGIAKKAENIVAVLKKRNDIESYLTNLQVKRAKEDSVALPEEKAKAGVQQQVTPDQQQPLATDVKAPKQTVVRPAIDSSLLKKPVAQQSAYIYRPEDQHFVALILDKVDVVYVNEAKNAFSRYNRETYYGQQIDMTVLPLNDQYKIILMAGYADAASALEYVDKAKRVAGAQIVPWLAADKYSFTVISAGNLEVLKTNKDLQVYKQFVGANYPATLTK
jgi:tetratricopeptide (TPR) repeat protein